jgi:hypothetical protein
VTKLGKSTRRERDFCNGRQWFADQTLEPPKRRPLEPLRVTPREHHAQL